MFKKLAAAEGQPKGTSVTARNSASPQGSQRTIVSSSALGGTASSSVSDHTFRPERKPSADGVPGARETSGIRHVQRPFSASSQKGFTQNSATVNKPVARQAAGPTAHLVDERKEECSGCGKTFKRINSHVCKGPTLGDDGKEKCSGCGKTFKRINSHVCKGPTPDYERKEEFYVSGRTIKQINSNVSKGPTHDVLSDHSSTNPERPPPARRSISGSSASSFMPLDDEAEQIMEELRLNCSSDPRRDTLEFFNTEVQLLQAEKERVSDSFNRLREQIVEELIEKTNLDWTYLNSGSSYDGTKVTRPDEFDCMLFPSIPEECLKICLEKAPPGYCFVEFHPSFAKSADKDTMDYLKKLSVQKYGVTLVRSDLYRNEIHGILAVAVDGIRRARADPNYNPGSPAFPVILNAIPRDDTLRAISIDFVPGLHLNNLPTGTRRLALNEQDKRAVKDLGFDVTPKQCNRDRSNQSVLWRLSFSRAEKHLTKFADSGAKTCRKDVLRILKRLLEVIKGFDNSKRGQKNDVMISLKNARQRLSQRRTVSIQRFTTYEIRMLMLREFHVNYPKAEDWTRESRRGRLQHALGELKKMLKGSVVVPHFFLPGVIPDIMGDVPRAEREFLYIMFTIAEKLL